MSATVTTRTFEEEPERATIHANGIVVDVTANDDGTVYIECYSYATGQRAEVREHAVWSNRPSFTLGLIERPSA